LNLSATQRRFLGFFLDGEPHRANWLRDGRKLRPVADPFVLDPEADRIQVYRLADADAPTFIGDAVNRTTLSVDELAELAPCWEIPLRRLNDLGASLAGEAPPPPPIPRTFKLPEAMDAALKAKAAGEGRPVNAVLVELVERYLGKGS